MQIYSNQELGQKSNEWLLKRAEYFTASEAQAIASDGAGLDTLCKKKAMILSGIEPSDFSNEHTDRGNELEPIARSMFELETGFVVDEVGFIADEKKSIGCSPDGLIGNDYGIEIKCINNEKYADMIFSDDKLKKAESKYIWQCQHSLLVTGRKMWYLVYYNPNFKQNLIILEIYPDEEKHKKILCGVESGKVLLEHYKFKLK